MSFGIKLHVWGDFACFTRPEMKVERVSYDAITPSAARSILDAISTSFRPNFRRATLSIDEAAIPAGISIITRI